MDGASSMDLSPEGELIVHTEKGNLAFSKPIAYQEINGKRVPVSVAYILASAEDTASGPIPSTSHVPRA